MSGHSIKGGGLRVVARGDSAIRADKSPKPLAGRLSVVAAGAAGAGRGEAGFDVLGFAAAFPGKWQDYLKAHFDDVVHVARSFRVSERAARKWWDGIGGPRGDKVMVALAIHGEAAALRLAA